jgi:trehalose/maltose transport system substrate-binding protein
VAGEFNKATNCGLKTIASIQSAQQNVKRKPKASNSERRKKSSQSRMTGGMDAPRRKQATRCAQRLNAMGRTPGRLAALSIELLCCAMLCASCGSKPKEPTNQPVTITFVGWGPATLSELNVDRSVFADFTKETGIQVKFIVGTESMTDRLKLYEEAFKKKASTPDVLYTDVVWPGVLSENLIDLKPYLGDEARNLMSDAVENNTVNGRLVAMPFNMEVGLIYYRTDLLKKYGYKNPPGTWNDLERMAKRIQEGERTGGHKEFWGFVWEGAPYEGLTCNALEWQAAEGGGRIIEDDGTISVNNPQTVRALKMAKRWIGTISPPSVLAFKEADARNIWDFGNAAFRRDWVWRGNPQGNIPDVLANKKYGASLPPAGSAGVASVLGGQSLGVSKYSEHPKEAAELVRFLTSRKIQLWLWEKGSMLPVLKEFYEDPKFLATRPDLQRWKAVLTGGATRRPSGVSGVHYAEVSRTYFTAVHAVLSGQVSAEKGMADLEAELVKITGLKAGKPKDSAVSTGKSEGRGVAIH